VTGAIRVAKHKVDATIGQVTSELKEALAPGAHPPRP
jgi:hypothetical protein